MCAAGSPRFRSRKWLSAGWVAGWTREEAGLPADTGAYRVVTTLATLDFHPESKRMRLNGLNPGVTKEQVLEEIGFELLVADTLEENAAPLPRSSGSCATRSTRSATTSSSGRFRDSDRVT